MISVSRKNSISSIEKILKLLLENTEFEQYKMKKTIEISYKTIIENLRRLEYANHVKYRNEKSSAGGRDKKIYSLTIIGLIEALHLTHKSLTEKNFDTIAAKHPDMLPLIFGKWQFFEAHGLTKEVIANIKNYLENSNAPLTEGFGVSWYNPEIDAAKEFIVNAYLSPNFGYDPQIDTAKEKTVLKLRLLDSAMKEKEKNLITFVLFNPQTLSDFLPVFKCDKELSALTDIKLKEIKQQCETDLWVMQTSIVRWERIKKGEIFPANQSLGNDRDGHLNSIPDPALSEGVKAANDRVVYLKSGKAVRLPISEAVSEKGKKALGETK